MSISLLDLVRDVAGVTLLKSQTVSDWSTRPFTPRQVDYLVDDVRYLFAIADRLNEQADARAAAASWALEEMRTLVDPRTYRSDKRRLYLRVAGNARMNRRELGVLNELALLREAIARERNIPLKYVLPDDVLVGSGRAAPEVGRRAEPVAPARRRHAQAHRRRASSPRSRPAKRSPKTSCRRARRVRSARSATRWWRRSRCLINAVAAANDLPAALLVSRVEIERIARDLPQSPEELAAAAGPHARGGATSSSSRCGSS